MIACSSVSSSFGWFRRYDKKCWKRSHRTMKSWWRRFGPKDQAVLKITSFLTHRSNLVHWIKRKACFHPHRRCEFQVWLKITTVYQPEIEPTWKYVTCWWQLHDHRYARCGLHNDSVEIGTQIYQRPNFPKAKTFFWDLFPYLLALKNSSNELGIPGGWEACDASGATDSVAEDHRKHLTALRGGMGPEAFCAIFFWISEKQDNSRDYTKTYHQKDIKRYTIL